MEWPKQIITNGKKILDSLDSKNITPKKENVLNFLKSNPFIIKVVIIGQDPYPTKGVATGYAFAVNKGAKIPLSLQNIFKEIKEVQKKLYADETLVHWQKQGVLLLNASLSTEIAIPNAHKHIWKEYILEVITWLDQNFDITWVLWGKSAQTIGEKIKGHKIIDAHPSPLSFRHRKKHTFKELDYIKW